MASRDAVKGGYTHRVDGADRLFKKLKKLAGDGRRKNVPEIIVGFAQTYAVYVHENLNANYRVGQAKFLEEPARTKRREIRKIVRVAFAKTRDMRKAMMLGALRLMREAQMLTPVDTSALKASAFVAFEEDYEAKSKEAFARSEAIRVRVLARRKQKK